jgi:hypothetical protein
VCIAHQHHVALTVEVPPLLATHTLKVEPGRAAQVARVGHQRVAVQGARKQLLAECHRLVSVGRVQSVGFPHRLRRLDDERARLVVELVDVRLEPAVLRLLEGEVEGIPVALGAEPDEAVRAGNDVGEKDVGVFRPDLRIDTIRRDDQVSVRKIVVRVHLDFESQHDAHFFTAALQDVQQVLASDADEAVPTAADRAALEVQFDVVPVDE